MTYKKALPKFVTKRWRKLNGGYNIEVSLNSDCIKFIEKHFNKYISRLFRVIPEGKYKADLWRLCKLYIEGGVYADVDLIPHKSISILDDDNTFYSCLNFKRKSIFQAFMVVKYKKSPLILCFILSFLLNNPHTYKSGPTYDMHNCIKYNIEGIVESEKVYNLNQIKIPVTIGSSNTNIKRIDLHYFPSDVKYNVKLSENKYADSFDFMIDANKLVVKRTDETTGWDCKHTCDIIIECDERIFLFQEYKGETGCTSCYVDYKNEKILDSRDKIYYRNGGW
tara:strand:- start:3639 stop:4478 length:840 start_codon:yes stop_codon:yes gene_type:complete